MRSQHIWTERDGEGRKREIRATKFGGQWKLQAKTAGEENWTYFDDPPMEDLVTLKDIVERKYQRRRASYEDAVSIENLIRQKAGNE
jgi:hypothetical protein